MIQLTLSPVTTVTAEANYFPPTEYGRAFSVVKLTASGVEIDLFMHDHDHAARLADAINAAAPQATKEAA